MKRLQTLFLVELSIFVAIEIIFCFTPLGSLPIIPLGIVMTLAHIPAIIAALVLGKKAAGIIGGVMGVSSLIIWTFMPPNPLVAFAFSPFVPNGNIFSLLICVVPRFIFPIVTAWLFIILRKRMTLVLSAALSAAAGTFVHSFLVLSGIYLAFHANKFVGGNYINFIVAWGGLNAVIEIIAAVVIAAAVIIPLDKIKNHKYFAA